VPSSAKVAPKRGKKLIFPPSPPIVEIKGKRPFKRSLVPKEVPKEHSLPEVPIRKKKGKCIENPVEESIEKPVEEKKETHVHKGKGKGTKRPLERKEETPVKHFEEPMVRNEETTEQEEEGKK
jgi:hypothetical protein